VNVTRTGRLSVNVEYAFLSHALLSVEKLRPRAQQRAALSRELRAVVCRTNPITLAMR
jgi:hypothetical protein